ncbi:LacI family DNA-binding transcriptional regulator [Dongshaea marina]|uniref:LacI family DNA-binding transcriptional regulator n=1 Tax=Dongshaea marina TaxID=2047966 RepID=UPI0019025F34|nr:LacI family DNA-binding transcriptional regulator [Dongshaea marina]
MTVRKRATIEEVARQAGVSKTTASLVLNGSSKKYRIAEATQLRVQEAARRCEYTPSFSARTLRSGRSQTLALVIPDFTNLGFVTIARELEHQAREAGYQLLLACTQDDPSLEQEVVRSVLARQVDALLVASSLEEDDLYQSIHQKNCPVVQIDRCIADSSLPYVISDAVSSTQELVASLAADQPAVYYLGASPSIHRVAIV